MKKFLIQFWCVAAAMMLVVACSNAPKPGVTPVEQQQKTTEEVTSEPTENAASMPAQILDTAKVEKEELPEESTEPVADSLKQSDEGAPPEQEFLPLPPQSDTVATEAPRIDPYEEIKKIVAASFAYADSLLTAKNPDLAIVEIERFTVLHPLWESWYKRAAETLQRAKETASTQARYGYSSSIYSGINVTAGHVDAYVEIQKIVASSFAYADSMIAFGMPERAVTEMERVVALNAVWNAWMQEAEKISASAAEMQKESQEQWSALTSRILNENATSADYVTVKTLTDSLIALEPGDSLKAFASRQVEISYKKSVKKALTEKSRIQENAEKSGDFALADSLANRLLLRYRDFADTLKLEQWVESIHAQAVLNSMDSDYWKKNKPADVFAKAEKLVAANKFAEAKELYLKLTTSSERERALKSLKNLGHDACVMSRKNASRLFAGALSAKKKEDKKQKLENAIEALMPCIENFADDPEAGKAREDKKVLEQELK